MLYSVIAAASAESMQDDDFVFEALTEDYDIACDIANFAQGPAAPSGLSVYVEKFDEVFGDWRLVEDSDPETTLRGFFG